jgi:N-acyl homoserine lactone hydrolase
VDLLGDGSVRLVSTPGHTKGHMSVLVRTGAGEALLAGDAAYTLRNVREQALPLLTADAGRHRRSLAELKAFMDARPGAPLVPSHDPEAYRALAR